MTEVWSSYRDQIAGCWKCVSYEMFAIDSDGGRAPQLLSKPHGDRPNGRLSISPQGWLAAHLARPDRIHVPSGQPFRTASDREVAHAARGLGMYCGPMKLFDDGAGGLYLQTTVKISSDAVGISGVQERKVRFVEEGGRTLMVLEPKQDMLLEDGTRTRAILKWEKFE